MVTDAIKEVAEKLPKAQTSRGAEFRNTSVEDRYRIARHIVIAQCQATAANGNWNNESYRYHMRKRKNIYFHECGLLDIDYDEAEVIWWRMVHDDPAPNDRRELI